MKLKELLKDIEVVELAASSDAEINGTPSSRNSEFLGYFEL